MDLQKVGVRIKKFRERQGLTQDEIAEYLDISRPKVSLIESGERTINLNNLEKLADLFGIDLALFFSDEEEQINTELAFAFRTNEVNQSDLKQIARFKKIVKNHQKMRRLISEK